MSDPKLTVQLRTETGKGAARKLRQAGRIPGVIYGADAKTESISVDERQLSHIVQEAGAHSLIDLQVAGGDNKGAAHRVLIKDLVRDPVRDDMLHVDFHAVALDQEMQTVVMVVVEGEEGRTDDGVVAVVLRELDIACLPTAIPESVSVDVAELAIGDVVTVADIAAPAGVRFLNEPDEAVVTITPPQVEEAEATDDEAAEKAGEAASADAEAAADKE